MSVNDVFLEPKIKILEFLCIKVNKFGNIQGTSFLKSCCVFCKIMFSRISFDKSLTTF